MKLSDLKARLPEFVIPLHDLNWMLQEVRNEETTAYAFPPTEEEILETLTGVSPELIVGFPEPEEDNTFMFGFKDEGYLDDRSTIDFITNKHWEEISGAEIITFRTMESYSKVIYDEDVTNKRQHKTEVDDFLTHLIGRSLSSSDPIFIRNTADCKKFIEETYSLDNMKRTSTNKWGNFNYRLFENDNGDEVSVVVYNGVLISHYNFSYKDR